ncbi:MAG: PD-(D/E)XK nuclease family protein [Prevotellaceae bacterium]|jgi:hypothetical protein|nr:PD-(D/E)XK nuclease family protein [Prevotellaceae bacterium]
MDEKQQVKSGLNFVDKVIAQESDNAKQLLTLVSAFMAIHKKAAATLPYHINVIDELHAKENAHSRILAKLLQQKAGNNRFEILESFIGYLKEKKSGLFDSIKIETPEITQETERIDLRIRDKTYAIIIENKIHYAPDQAQQLARYIDKTKNGTNEKQIFVVYLSPNGEEPNEQSWGEYKNAFSDRYLNLSFKDDILSWLKEKVVPEVKLKDVFLRSAIEQYIDHLEGIFEIRTINNKINMELQKFIKKELELNGTPQENIAKLAAKQEEINKVNNQIEMLKSEAEKEIFREWQRIISGKYPDWKSVYEEGRSAGLIVQVKESVAVRVSISYNSQLYCQIDMDIFEGQILPEEVREKTQHLLPKNNNNNQVWQYFPRYDYDGVFKCFQEVINILTQ